MLPQKFNTVDGHGYIYTEKMEMTLKHFGSHHVNFPLICTDSLVHVMLDRRMGEAILTLIKKGCPHGVQ